MDRKGMDRHCFDLALADPENDRPDPLIAAFGILLSRYHSAEAVEMTVLRGDFTGDPGGVRVRPSRRFRLDTSAGVTVSGLLGQLDGPLDPPSGKAGEAETECRSTLIWLETGSPVELEREPGWNQDGPCLVAMRSGRGFRCALVHEAEFMTCAAAERVAGHLDNILAQMARTPELEISRVPLLTARERDWIEARCDGPSRPLANPLPAHRIFERQVVLSPLATALRHRDRELSYHDLNRRANRLARVLLGRALGREARVMVCLEPSFDIAVALLAILKIGAVYVPLEPTYPPARIRALIESCRPALILSRRYLADQLGISSRGGALFLALEDVEESGKGDPSAEANPEIAVQPEDAAYIFHTSGTTGHPKGVVATHANLRHYAEVARDHFRMIPSDIMPAIARFSFSISLFELMTPLLSGATVLLLDRDAILDPERMSRTLSEVTFFHAGPSLLKGLLSHIKRRHPDFENYSRVRHASSGGDMVPPEVLEDLKRVFRNAEVYVIYGCSEISCMGCAYPVPREQPVRRTFVGRPFDNGRVRLLDSELGSVPVGVAGEIWYSGTGVTRGYLDAPELTASKFVTMEGRRFYRTGDLGRLSEDGWLEMLGRRDFQVQLRGMRVELAEVEYHLRRAPGVIDGVVVARDSASGEKTLAAYLVAEKGTGGTDGPGARKAAVRRHLRENLPEYMVPSVYVELDRLPLNPNMKVDRRQLPEPGPQDRIILPEGCDLSAPRPPHTPTEKRLASLWKDLLRVDQVGLDDNFFDLGGDSILGLELILRIRSTLGVQLDGIEILFESLGIQALLCDQRVTAVFPSNPDSPRPAPIARLKTLPFDSFHFGSDQSLYGILFREPAIIEPASARAALFCPPLGQEAVRTQFVFQRLALKLVAQGIAVMRFDFHGHGDSLGEAIEADCSRWKRDIREAHEELVRRTGSASVALIGARLGATLLWSVLDQLDGAGCILWDPVQDGEAHLKEMARMHRRYLRNIRNRRRWRRPAPPSEGIELLGTVYSEKALRELRQTALTPLKSARSLPVQWLGTSGEADPGPAFRSLGDGGFERLDLNCGWMEVEQLEQILPDSGISNALTAMVLKNHERNLLSVR